ncbi:hypothetical protein ACFPRL_28620 [Pseudoclavibacter helvolus]
MQRGDERDRPSAVAGLADDLDSGLVAQDVCHRLADEGLIVDHEHAGHSSPPWAEVLGCGRCCRGRVTATR